MKLTSSEIAKIKRREKKRIISEYMSDIGRRGGLVRNEKKAAQARINGRLGGRPRKVEKAKEK